MEDLRLEKIRPEEVHHLVFSGGGVKGSAHVTALAAAVACGVNLSNVVGCNGTSAGSITATLVAMGYDVDTMFSIMRRLDFRKFLFEKPDQIKTGDKMMKAMNKIESGDSGLAGAKLLPKVGLFADRISYQGGIYQVDMLRNWIEELVASQTDTDFCTFQELHELASKKDSKLCDLEIIVFNKNTHAWERLNATNASKVVISSAVAASCAFPGFFVDCHLYEKTPGTKPEKIDDCKQSEYIYCDGGMGNNFDIAAWDLKTNGDDEFNRSVLGFRLTSTKNVEYLRGEEKLPSNPVERGFVNFVIDTLIGLKSQQFNNLIMSPKNLARTVAVDTKGVSTLGLGLYSNPEAFEELLKSGWDSACDYFGKKLEFPEKYKVTPTPANRR